MALIIPYLLWSLAIFARDYLLSGEPYTLAQYARKLLTGRVISGYYYVPMLCQLFLLSPLLVRMSRRNWRQLLVITAVIQLIVQVALYLDSFGMAVPKWLMFWTQSWLFPNNLFWFALGIVIGFNLKPFKVWVGRTKQYWLATAVVLIPLGVLEWELIQNLSGVPFLPNRLTLVDSLYAVSVIFAFLAYEKVTLPRETQLNDLGTKSFGVYLTNSLILMLTARVIAFFVPFLLAYQIIFQPILWVAGLGIPLLLMTAVGHPKSPIRTYYQYIFG